MTNIPLALIAWAIGIVVGAAFIIIFKKPSSETEGKEVEEKDATVTKQGEEFNLDF